MQFIQAILKWTSLSGSVLKENLYYRRDQIITGLWNVMKINIAGVYREV